MPTDPAILLDLPFFAVRSGKLCFMQVDDHIPFDIDAVTWSRGDEARRTDGAPLESSEEAVVVALSGSLAVEISRDRGSQPIHLDRADQRLYVKGAWRVRDQSRGSIALVAWTKAPNWSWPIRGRTWTGAEASIDPRHSSVADCGVIQLPRSEAASGAAYMLRLDPRSSLKVRRVYYLTDIPHAASRGGHAHRQLYQYLVATRGSFDVDIDDGLSKRSVRLSRPDRALRLVPGIWRELRNFSEGSVCLVMASEKYDEADYLRRYRDFRAFKQP